MKAVKNGFLYKSEGRKAPGQRRGGNSCHRDCVSRHQFVPPVPSTQEMHVRTGREGVPVNGLSIEGNDRSCENGVR